MGETVIFLLKSTSKGNFGQMAKLEFFVYRKLYSISLLIDKSLRLKCVNAKKNSKACHMIATNEEQQEAIYTIKKSSVSRCFNQFYKYLL